MNNNVSYVVCKICGAKKRVLTQHLQLKHGMTRQEYETQYQSPAVCLERKLVQVARNKKLNDKLSTDPYYIELMKKVRHENAMKTLVTFREGAVRYQQSARGKKRNSEIMKDLHQNHDMQKKATQGKLGSEKFKKVHSEQLSRDTKERWQNKEWRDSHLKKMWDGSKKQYTDCNGDIVYLRSSWELKLYNYLITHDIEFEYEAVKIQYQLKDISHTYIPDFYLPKYNMLLEVKPHMYTTNKKNQVKRKASIDSGFEFDFITETELKDLNCYFHNKL